MEKNKNILPFTFFRLPSQGFTLLEMLVVIAIIAVIIGLALPNFLGARERARDYKRKAEMAGLKAAFRLYYQDYNKYPGWSVGTKILGCGTNGTSECPVCTTAEFAAGGADGCQTIYMRKLPKDTSGGVEYRYYQTNAGDDFRLKVSLENASDADIAVSQTRCPTTTPVGSATNISYGTKDYVVCAD